MGNICHCKECDHVEPEEVICPHCGHEGPLEDGDCAECGAKLKEDPDE